MNVVTVPAKPNIEVPLSLQAAKQLIEKRKGKDADDLFDQMLDAAEDISKTADKVKDTVDKILANQMATQIARVADARKTANKLFTRIAPKLDSTRQKVEATIEQLEAKTQPPQPKDTNAMLLAGEIRVALLRMSPVERTKAVTEAINDGDDSFVSAATSANPTLTGLGRAEAAALQDAWRRKRHGPTLERIDRLRAGLNEFNRVGSLLQGWSLGLLADKNAGIAAAEKSAELARAAMQEVA